MSLTDEKVEFLLKEVAELKNKYGVLHLKLNEGKVFLIGKLDFTATLNGNIISDSYQIKFEFPQSYPDIPPEVNETGGSIPKNTEHHVNPDNTLCLGPPLKVLLKFRKEPTILNFIENCLIPILYWHSYRERYPEKPLPAYPHGNDGIKEYHNETNLKEDYFKILETDNINVVLLLIKMFLDETYKSNPKCPCRRGQRLKDCHGKNLQILLDMSYLKKYLKLDYDKMFQEAKEHGEIDDIRLFSPRQKRNRIMRKK